ncbi:alcohol dehydrogenase catalytic domain-containing protein [Polaromonas hydrogenivorans]|uniref:Alcohol dehydrogenase catalytic domain-containing protein n=1 Tax=Polaromonas hydrogenivorans TaxID=335476 RepID=A0AAU7LZN8_9BURK
MSIHGNKAVTFDELGKLRWAECPDTPLRADEIEVSVGLSTVNPIDVKRRHGYGRRVFQLKGANAKNLALGNDFVGTISKIGSAVVDLKPGDRVFGVKPPSKYGPHALRVVVKQEQALRAVPDLSDELLVTLPYNTCTVLRSFESIGLNPLSAKDKKILVCGASGGLGSIALGLLRQWGAEITAVARAENHARCLAQGACVVCTVEELSDRQARFDAVLNFASWELDSVLCSALRSGAMGYATTVHPLLSLLDEKGLLPGAIAALHKRRQCRKNVPQGARYAWALFSLKAGDLQLMQDFALSARPQPHIGIRTPMPQAHLAFAHVEQMRAGRALLANITH